jgi:hypothetical protein
MTVMVMPLRTEEARDHVLVTQEYQEEPIFYDVDDMTVVIMLAKGWSVRKVCRVTGSSANHITNLKECLVEITLGPKVKKHA